MKRVLLTGITGQTASYMADKLLALGGYEIHGIVRRSSRGYGALENIHHLVYNPDVYRKKLFLHIGDLSDQSSIVRIMQEVRPDYILNFAAQADVAESFYQPEYTLDVTGIGVVRLLEAMRRVCPQARFYQASTSELFGKTDIEPQNEQTPLNPQSPYSVAKYVGYQMVRNYREGYGLFACQGISFNHASERRTDDYVDRKVTRAVARIKVGLQKDVRLGNLESYRDWSYAPDIVEGIWKIINHDVPDDFVLGSGVKVKVKDWVAACFEEAGLSMEEHLVHDPALFRPNEVDNLLADASKAERVLGWKATLPWRKIVFRMMDHDMALARRSVGLSDAPDL